MYSKMILYICGFWVQIFPCAFFCLYPFYDRFRSGRGKTLGVIAAVVAVASVCFAWLYVLSPIPGDYDYFAADLVFYATLICLLVIYIFMIQAHIFHKLFVFLVVMNYGFLVTTAVSFVYNHVMSVDWEYIYEPLWLVVYAAANAALFFPMRFVLRQVRQAFLDNAGKKIWLRLCLIPLAFILVLSVCYELPSKTRMDSGLLLELFAGAVQVLMLFFICWILQLIKQERNHAEQNLKLQAALANYRNRAESTHENRKIRHEVMHHITALSLFLQNQDYSGASEYLGRMYELASAMPVVEYTPHALLNAMLTEYRKRAEAAGIRVDYLIFVPGPVALEDMDLCSFFSNLMDNAIEGASRVESGERDLHLTIRQNGNFLFFSCENACEESQLRYVNGKPVSSKANAAGFGFHGYGISIMEEIAGKYNGAIQISARDGRFCVAANLCLPDKAGQADKHRDLTEEDNNVSDRDLR